MTTETALPTAGQPAAASEQQQTTAAPAASEKPAEGAEQKLEQPEGEQAKKEKTAEEREIARLRRRVDNLTRRYYEATTGGGNQHSPSGERPDTTTASQATDEPLTLSRAELQRMIDQEAAKRTSTIEQRAQQENLSKAAKAAIKELGADRFQELTDDLAAVFDERKQLAVLRTERPADVIQHLTDPENADEADAIARMDDFDAGRAIARIEARMAAKRAEAKPQPSKAAAPIEAVRGGGTISSAPDPRDTKAWMKWANEQEAKGYR